MKATTFRVVNAFHRFEAETSDEGEVKGLVADSRPSDCQTRTYIYRVEDGVIVGRVDFDGDTLRDL